MNCIRVKPYWIVRVQETYLTKEIQMNLSVTVTYYYHDSNDRRIVASRKFATEGIANDWLKKNPKVTLIDIC